MGEEGYDRSFNVSFLMCCRHEFRRAVRVCLLATRAPHAHRPARAHKELARSRTSSCVAHPGGTNAILVMCGGTSSDTIKGRAAPRRMQRPDPYNAFCTNWGCFQGTWRDDVDSGWPSWGPPGCAYGANGSIVCTPAVPWIGAPTTDGHGRLAAPPLWHYTMPQDASRLPANCGPAGCGPVRSAPWSMSSGSPLTDPLRS